MTKQRRKKGHLPPFVPLIRTTLASPAWKQLSFGARSLYVVLRSYLRVDNLNNGKVYRSYREAAADLGTNSMRSIQRWFRELEHYGFIVKTAGAHLGVDGDGIAAHWRLTECPTFDAKGTHIAPTRDFERWDGTLFDDPVKTESPIPNECTPHSKGAHTGTPKRAAKRPRCTQKGHIDSEASMYSKGAHNCLPLPSLLSWATPSLVEVTDPTEKAAIQDFWRQNRNKKNTACSRKAPPPTSSQRTTRAWWRGWPAPPTGAADEQAELVAGQQALPSRDGGPAIRE